MIAAFATLVFLATIVTLVGIAAMILGESGPKIAAALRGQSPLASAPKYVPVAGRVSRARSQRPVRAQARLRAAA
jgi:hypothetical protein